MEVLPDDEDGVEDVDDTELLVLIVELLKSYLLLLLRGMSVAAVMPATAAAAARLGICESSCEDDMSVALFRP